MKNYFICFVLALLGCQSDSTSSRVIGSLKNIESGLVFILNAVTGDSLATGPISDYTFNIITDDIVDHGTVIPTMIVCQSSNLKISTAGPLALEPGTIHLVFDKTGISTSGTPTQDEFNTLLERVGLLDKKLSTATSSETKNIINATGAAIDSFYHKNRKGRLHEFASMILADQIAGRKIDPSGLMYTRTICNNSEDIDTFDQYVCQAIEVFNRSWENSPVKLFNGSLPDGTTLAIQDYLGQKLIIIDFWATWCGPCVKEFPKLKELYTSGDIEIIGISIDSRDDGWLRSLEHHALPWPNIRDVDGQIKKLYDVSAVPTKFVVDKNGAIVARNPENLEGVLASLR